MLVLCFCFQVTIHRKPRFLFIKNPSENFSQLLLHRRHHRFFFLVQVSFLLC